MSELYENVDVTNFPPPLNVASRSTIMEHCKLDTEGFQRLPDLKAIRPWGIQRVEYFTPNGSAKFDPENSDREKVQELYRAENARRLAVGLPLLPIPTTPTKAFSQGVTIGDAEILNADGNPIKISWSDNGSTPLGDLQALAASLGAPPAVLNEQAEPGNSEPAAPSFTGTEPDLDDLTEAQLEALTRPADSIPATEKPKAKPRASKTPWPWQQKKN